METSAFAGLGLSAKVLAAVETAGYATPTPIQVQAIPVAVTGRDVLGIAQTGTGKTASFVLPMITRLESGRARARMPRSLILAPTRELAAQCAQSFEKYGQHTKLSIALLIGGVSMDDQVQKLDRGVDVLIATPGRLLDHFQRGRLMLMGVEILVIDEADRMLDMGFIPDIEKICKLLPPRRQTLFFSATMPTEITRLVDQFLRDPVRIEVAKPATAATTIAQRFRFCASSEDFAKREALREILRRLDVKNAIIFSNYKRDVAILLKSLTKHGFNAGALHGDMDQMSRMSTLDKFRSGEISLLAASDVAARGLDIPDVSHVINFDVPWQPDDYVHRIGRTGRAGKEGCSVTIVTPDDIKSIDAIAKLIGDEPHWLGDPPDADVLEEARSRKGRGRARGRTRTTSGPGRDRGGRPGESRGRPVRNRADATDQPPRREVRRERAPRLENELPPRELAREARPVDAERKVADTPPPPAPRRDSEPRRDRELQPARRSERDRHREDRDPVRARERDDARPHRETPEDRRPTDRGERPRSDARPRPEPRSDGPRRAERQGEPRPDAKQVPDSRADARGPKREPRDRDVHRADSGTGKPQGLGDHVPAFLRRPVRANAD